MAAPIILILLVLGGRQASRNFFTLREVVIREATPHLTEEEILKLSGIQLGANLLTLRLSGIEENLHRFSWIKEVSLLKRYPGRLYIEVKEQEPVALVFFGNWFYVSPEGTIFKKLTSEDFTNYPVLTGLEPNGSELLNQAVSFLTDYQKTTASRTFGISELHWDPSEGFSVYTLRPSFRILFGQENLNKRLAQWEKVGATLSRRGENRPQFVDMTYNKRVFVKTRTTQTEGRKQDA